VSSDTAEDALILAVVLSALDERRISQRNPSGVTVSAATYRQPTPAVE
jgi:hypothetical protein